MSTSVRYESTRRWIAGLAVTLTTIIAYFAFWRLAPIATFVTGCVALTGLAVSAWILGGSDANPPPGK